MIFILCFFVAHWYLSLFSQTFFLHRYAAHRAFNMNKGWERFFFVLTYITQGSSYLSPWAYGIMHRIHHAYTDTEDDPHSPTYDKSIFSMMWRTKKIYSDILYKRMPVDPRFTKHVPQWRTFDLMASSTISRVLWIGLYTWVYISFAPVWWLYLLLPVHYAMGPVHGVIINWFAHKYGHVNFETDNTSKNLFKVDWLMMGEGYHNNHHVHPSRSNFASGKGEFDFCYPVIKMLHKLRVIQMATVSSTTGQLQPAKSDAAVS
jgi:stearoyl-CoA desaturase (delta-9 desaturase)